MDGKGIRSDVSFLGWMAYFQVLILLRQFQGVYPKKTGSCSTPPLRKLLLPAGLEPSSYRLVEAKLPVMVFIEGGGFLVPWVHVKGVGCKRGYEEFRVGEGVLTPH